MKRVSSGEKFLDNIFDFTGALSGYVLRTFFLLCFIIFQFTIWMNLSGILCVLAYLAEISIYSIYLTWLTRVFSVDKEIEKMRRSEGTTSPEILELNARLKRMSRE